MGNAPRLYYLDDIPTPYRLDVHRGVAELWPGPFKLAFCAASEPGRSWGLDLAGLDTEVLSGFQFRPRRQVNPISIKFNPSVWRSLQAFRPDVVVVSGYLHPTVYLAAIWCRLHGVPYAVACETSQQNTATVGLKASLKKLVAAWMVGGMAFGLPVGREAARYLEFLDARRAPMFHFPNAPNAAGIAQASARTKGSATERAARREFGISQGSRIVLFVGRMIDAKRPMDLLDAFMRIGPEALNATLVFVGGGPLLTELRARAQSPRRVIFTDWIEEPERVHALMAIASVFVLPSQHEPWGAVVNEAMASGTAVIASDRVGAARDLIVSGENGFLVPAGDVEELTSTLERVLADDALRRRAGRAGQTTALARGHEFAARNLVDGAMFAIGRERSETERVIREEFDVV